MFNLLKQLQNQSQGFVSVPPSSREGLFWRTALCMELAQSDLVLFA